jgi:5-methylcytosine-specific restriction endonuclease McrBC regulatory subunit McrC
MLKEEKELFDWAVDMFGLDAPNVSANRIIKSDLRRLMKKLRLAVIGDICAQVADAVKIFPQKTQVKLLDAIMRYEKPKKTAIRKTK